MYSQSMLFLGYSDDHYEMAGDSFNGSRSSVHAERVRYTAKGGYAMRRKYDVMRRLYYAARREYDVMRIVY
jgi:hypothetical protein